MRTVSSFCFSCPLGSQVVSSVYHMPYQPPDAGETAHRSRLTSLCFVLGAKWRKGEDSNHSLVFVSVEEQRSYSLLKCGRINEIPLTCTVDDH